jgi:hypothetical protein
MRDIWTPRQSADSPVPIIPSEAAERANGRRNIDCLSAPDDTRQPDGGTAHSARARWRAGPGIAD